MPYRYIDDIATADAAFEARGSSVEELFISAAEAVMNVMVENLDDIDKKEQKSITCDAESREMLLFHLLDELVYYKDAEQLLLRISDVAIKKCKSGKLWRLTAQAYGEQINPEKHELNVDVKAVTFHRFAVEQTGQGWKAVVVLDVW